MHEKCIFTMYYKQISSLFKQISSLFEHINLTI